MIITRLNKIQTTDNLFDEINLFSMGTLCNFYAIQLKQFNNMSQSFIFRLIHIYFFNYNKVAEQYYIKL